MPPCSPLHFAENEDILKKTELLHVQTIDRHAYRVV